MERGGGQKQIIHTPPKIFLKVMELCLKPLPSIIYNCKCLLFIYRIFIQFFFQNDDQLLIKFHEILTVFFFDEHLQRKSTFYV